MQLCQCVKSLNKQASIIIQLNLNAHFAKWESSFTGVGAHPTNDPISNTDCVNVSFVNAISSSEKGLFDNKTVLNLDLHGNNK